MIKGGNIDKSIYINYETRELVFQTKTRVYDEDGHITSDAKVERSINIGDLVSFGSEALRFILSQDIEPLMGPASDFIKKMTESIEDVAKLTEGDGSSEDKMKLKVSFWNKIFSKKICEFIKGVERWFRSFSWFKPE